MLAKIGRTRGVSARAVESSMTMRQIELDFFFMQREIWRETKLHRLATLAAIREALGGS